MSAEKQRLFWDAKNDSIIFMRDARNVEDTTFLRRKLIFVSFLALAGTAAGKIEPCINSIQLIEPGPQAWEARIKPLDHSRILEF